MDKNYFLQEGEQTKLTSLVRNHVNEINKIIPDKSDIYKVIKFTVDYISSIPLIEGTKYSPECGSEQAKFNLEKKISIFRKRSSEQILKGGLFPSCSDRAQLFATFMRAQGISTSFLETVYETHLLTENEKKSFAHAMNKVYFNDEEILVDPRTKFRLYRTEKQLFDKDGWIIAVEGLDSKDIGVHNQEDWLNLKEKYKDILMEKYLALTKAYFSNEKEKVMYK